MVLSKQTAREVSRHWMSQKKAEMKVQKGLGAGLEVLAWPVCN